MEQEIFLVETQQAFYQFFLSSLPSVTENQKDEMSRTLSEKVVDISEKKGYDTRNLTDVCIAILSGNIRALDSHDYTVKLPSINTVAISNGLIVPGEIMTREQKIVSAYLALTDE